MTARATLAPRIWTTSSSSSLNAVRGVEADQGQRTDDHLVADQGHGEAGHHVGGLRAGRRGRQPASLVGVVEDRRPIANGPAADALARPDRHPQVFAVVAGEGAQPV